MRNTKAKEVLSFLPLIYGLVSALAIALNFVGRLMGYQLVLYNDVLESAITAILFLSLTICLFVGKVQLNALNQIMISLLLVFVILIQNYFVVQEGSSLKQILLIFFALVSVGSEVCLFFKYRFCVPFKIVCGFFAIIFSIWMFLMMVIILFEIVFGEFGQTSVVRQVPSPSQSQTAEIVDVDLGATGGSTLVRLAGLEGKGIPVLIGELVRERVVVYEGEWGEFETMEVYWKDDQTLVIDGEEYKAK